MNTIFFIFEALLVAVSAFRPGQVFTRRLSTSRNLFGSPEPPKNSPAKKEGGGGLFGNMGNMMENMKKAQEIAKQAEVLNKELADTIIVGNDPSGQVAATFNGLGMPIGIKIADSMLSQGSEAVSLAASQAMVDAHAKSQQTMISKMQQMYANAGVPLPMK